MFTARRTSLGLFLILLAAGCDHPVSPPPRAEVPRSNERSLPRQERTAPDRPATRAEISYDTAHDEKFANFVAKTAGTMIKKVAVGLERKGIMRVELGESTPPEDVLPLTKSLLAGARKDFPDKALTVAMYDPHGEAIVKAHYSPGEGVRYDVARGDGHRDQTTQTTQTPPTSGGATETASGTTEKDRKFARWALETGHAYLRYVQADLESRGRLWFGVTRDVKPEDLSGLTKSLLEGAHTQFPRKELTATVFDPDGERVGRATLSADGKVHWAR